MQNVVEIHCVDDLISCDEDDDIFDTRSILVRVSTNRFLTVYILPITRMQCICVLQ